MPPGPVYLYVDGESHYIRTESAARKALGCKSLAEVRRHRSDRSGFTFWHREDCHFVWDSQYVTDQMPLRSYYFTSFTGDSNKIHEAKAFLREGPRFFDPEIIKEDKDKRKNRMAQVEEL